MTRRVVGLFRDGGEDAGTGRRRASRIGDPDALAWLCDRMTRGGLALGVAGRTAPLSGAEHAISHLLDMAAIRTGVPTGLHGAQVGVASVVVAALWQDILDGFDVRRGPGRAARRRARPGRASSAPSGSSTRRARWPPSAGGCTSASCAAWTDGVDAREAFVADWPAHLRGARRRAAVARARSWRACGRPGHRRPSRDLGASPDTARWAVSAAHLLRDRFGVLDLVDLTGRWTDADVDRVLARAAAAGGGL